MKAQKIGKRLGLALLVGFFLIANPAYFMACGETATEAEFQFGEEEMKTEVLGTWTGTVTYADNTTGDVTLVLEQGPGATALLPMTTPSWISSAYACGSREFVKSASACIESSSMPLTGTLTLAKDGSKELDAVAISGRVNVYGVDLDNFDLNVAIKGTQNFMGMVRTAADTADANLSLDGKSYMLSLKR